MSKSDDGAYDWTRDPREKHLNNDALAEILKSAKHLNTTVIARWRQVFNDVIGNSKTWKQIAEENGKTDIALLTMLRPDDEVAPKHPWKTRQSVGDLVFWHLHQGFSKADILYIVTGERKTENEKDMEAKLTKALEEIELKETTIRMMARNEQEN